MNKFALILFVAVLSSIHCHKFKREQNIEHGNPKNSDSEIISIVHTLHRRDLSPSIRMKIFGKELKVFLESSDNILFGPQVPVFLASRKSGSNQIEYTKYNHDLDFQIFHDVNKTSVFAIRILKDGTLLVDGETIGLNLKPISYSKRSIHDDPLKREEHEIYTIDHIVTKIKKAPIRSKIDIHRKKFARQKRNIQEKELVTHVYPEVLVATDYKTFKDHGADLDSFLRYMVVFWNGVDLMYRSFQEPKISLSITGIVIPTEKNVSLYNEKNDIINNTLLIGDFALLSLSKSFYELTSKLNISVDINAMITNYDIVDSTSTNIRGIALWEGVCQQYHYHQLTGSTALVEDDTKFEGIPVATHELGHLFGADDEDDNNSSSIMAQGYRPHEWSPSAVRAMKTFLQSTESRCLRNKPKKSTQYPKFLAGQVVQDLREQCNSAVEGSKPILDEREELSICEAMNCAKFNNVNKGIISFSSVLIPALTGTPCNNFGGVCFKEKCVTPN